MKAGKRHRPFIVAALVSAAAHLCVLAIPLTADLPQGVTVTGQVMRVDLQPYVPEAETPSQQEAKETAAVAKPSGGAPREAVVRMDGGDRRYRDYLMKVKRRIEERWIYPEVAVAKGEKGVATVRFSIDDRGGLVDYFVASSSGFPLLDEGALRVVRSAAPFDPLPAAMKITRLHIIADFHYE